jgi:predicted MPP superfamily phosphohydrolase
MTTILWITDPHLNFLRATEMARMFGECVREEHIFDRVVITGDIAEAHSVKPLLNLFAQGVGKDKPVAVVLGNHDHYGGSIASVNKEMCSGLADNLTWLDTAGPILLDDDTALVGKYAWYDALLGDCIKSNVMLHDFKAVAEFRAVFNEYDWEFEARQGSRNPLLRRLRNLAIDSATIAKKNLEEALKVRKHVVFATHIPPFAGACWHEGKLSDDQWMPWFTCLTMGKMLANTAERHPDCKILVLCGHTHSPGLYQHAPNLRVITGKARYGAPDVAGLIDPTAFEGW